MHPQLEAERFQSCREVIEALNECHKKQFYKKMFGVCNNEEEAMNKCLKEASTTAVSKATIEKRDKRKTLEAKWKKTEDEENEEYKILQILLERAKHKKFGEDDGKK
ncbi:hypothetical protein KAFR_0L01680 [Kazachstania africana CBS 2517]|uniref:COX assembly mitochondrial protein n=1 Tax=Kazachstania africana (strain ATCC 22294 / BCRC 22015 / CBS 2517 / CECT 1963 / NBRC 1671 / NRRL Y-8276) TaxID=1071382 RepID=H2B2C8_KAZAF|nr:hypothetical protein KAFR_0L01680 [Kazachstania africana CBS 2517]CCF60778.1 hypothetical protein KAFR_0L01680 [Kazachstania africana CBS 2517]